MEKITTIYVRLLDEGIEVFRPVKASHVKEKLYRILDEGFDPESEIWEFLPETIVQTELLENDKGGKFLAALKAVQI